MTESGRTDELCQACGKVDPNAECCADMVDTEIITLADGRRVLSVNGQGHFPLPPESTEASDD